MDSSYTLDKLSNHRPIRDEVFISLRNAILDGNYKSGEHLVENELAQQLNISRTPIREALRKLELEGLVAYTPRKGIIVLGVSSQDALEIYTIRAVLEGLAARLAAHHIVEEELDGLKHTLTEMKTCIEQHNIDALITHHSVFHNTIAKASKSPRLCQLIISLRDHVKKFSEIPCYLPGRLQYGWQEHKRIIDAIAQKNEVKAEHAARHHIMEAQKSLLRTISTNESEQEVE